MPRSVVCISHESGSGGRKVAATVAEDLGFRYVDEEILIRAADAEGVTVDELADVERRQSFLARLIHDFGHSPGDEHDSGVGVAGEVLLGAPTPASLRNAIRGAIDEVAESGNAVIVSHAASHALSGPDVLRVFVVAPYDARLARIAADETLHSGRADETLARHDAARGDYLRRFYGVEHELPHHYDLVVNTGDLDLEVAAAIIAGTARL